MANLTPENMIFGPGGVVVVEKQLFFLKKMSKMKLEFILKVEIEVEVGQVEVGASRDIFNWNFLPNFF